MPIPMDSSETLTLRIADLPVSLVLADLNAATRAQMLERYAAFRVPPQSAAVTIRVCVEPGAAYIPLNHAPTWQIRTAVRDGRIEFMSHFEMGWIERAVGQGALVLRPQGDPENFLRVLYAWLCLDHDALLLHACGVVRQGRGPSTTLRAGYVFFGPSGSGKTTTARLSLDQIVLSDDMVIIQKHGAGLRVCGVPFRGDLPAAPRTNGSADLRGIFTLVKDTQHSVAPLATAEAVARLAACVPFVMTQPANAQRVTQICAEIAARVPVRALHFRRDAGFWSVIDE